MKKIMVLWLWIPSIVCGQLYVQDKADWYMQKQSWVTVQGNLESYSDMEGEGTLMLSGSVTQLIDMHGFAINNLWIDNSQKILLGSALHVTQFMKLVNGNVYCEENNLVIGENAGITAREGSSVFTNGHGKIIKRISSNLTGYTVPLGTGTLSTPVSITTNGTYHDGQLTIGGNASPSPNKPSDVYSYLPHYWSIEKNGISGQVLVSAWYPQRDAVSGVYWEHGKWKPSLKGAGTVTGEVKDRYTELFAMNIKAIFSTFPNPAKTTTTVNVYSNTSTQGLFNILDVRGRIVQVIPVSFTSGTNQYTIRTESLRPGSYLLQAWTKEWNSTLKLVKL